MSGDKKQYGWLCWWNIGTSAIHDVKRLQDCAAGIPNLPDRIRVGIRGEDESGAWKKATRIGSKGIKASGLSSLLRGRYVTRDLEDGTRMVALETLDEANRTIDSSRVALMWNNGPGSHGHNVNPGNHAAEVESIIKGMYQDMDSRIGNMDGGKVRSLVLSYLTSVNRVSLRGDAGGVYFVPREDGRDDELLSIREWLQVSGCGSMTVVEMFEGKATTIQEVQESALEEMAGEIEAINRSLSEYAGNANMNAGSRMFSAGKMSERVDSLSEKMAALAVILEERVGTVQTMLSMVKRRADDMTREASDVVVAAKAERTKAVVVAPVVADSPKEDPKTPKRRGRPPGSKNRTDGELKTGTRRERASKVKL